MRQIIVLGVALLAAVAALFLVRGMASREPAPKEQAQVVTAGIPVLVAARPLSQGDKAAPGDLAWANFPQETLSPNFIQQSAAPQAMDEFTGAVARFNVEQGEPITASKLIKAGDQSFMAAMLTPGYRAISVPISAETAASGFIMPNDRVDILVTQRVQVTSGERSREDVKAAVILENVRVLAIDQTYRAPVQDKQPTPIIGGVATLELSPADAEVLTAANKGGSISMVLRGVQNEVGEAASARRRERTDSTIIVHKFGSMSEAAAPSSAGGAQ